VASDVQPQSLTLLTASTKGIRVSATRKLPTTSIDRDRLVSRDSATVPAVITMHTTEAPAST
jgi:hypothetical protein